MSTKKTWKIFFDLQCPYSRKCWQNLPAIKEKFAGSYDISVSYTSLAFHPQAFTAQCAATLVGMLKGEEARQMYQDTCFENQELYMNAALGDARKSEIRAVFALLAEKAGVLDGDLTKDEFIAKIDDWELAVKPAYTEHKVALAYQVYGTPKHVIEGKLIPDTDSSWGPSDWAEVLAKM
jgi:protein-disulfide isomerase